MGEAKSGRAGSRKSNASATAPAAKRSSKRAPAAPSLGLVEGLGPSLDPTKPDFAWWPIDRVKPWVQNPRKNARAVGKVADSIRRWGFGRPLVINDWPGCDGELIVGHTAWLAALELKLDQVPVRIRRMEPAAAHALAIADNKLGEISDWDPDELGRIVGSGEISAADLGIAGFSASELQAINNQGNLEDDEVPEPPRVPVTQPGDLWVLGDHRLVCGDSTNADHVALALGGAKPALMITDPPYGVNYDPNWRAKAAKEGKLSFAPTRLGKVTNDARASWTETWGLFPGSVAYVWHGALHATVVHEDLRRATFEVRAQVIWRKPMAPISRGHYHWQHEPCWYAVRKSAQASWIGGRKQTTVWDITGRMGIGTEEHAEAAHGTQKPLECMARPMRNHEGDAYDPFLGSGTTLIAAQKLGRRCYGLEIDPGYCDVIVERWKKLTGGAPERRQREAA